MIIKETYDVLIVANGASPAKTIFRTLAAKSKYLIAVDGGLKTFRRFAVKPDILIGDLDSTTNEDLGWIRRKNTKILPRRSQNATDLEKTLLYCRLRRWKNIAILSVNGNRPDHYLNGVDLAFKFPSLLLHYFIENMLAIPISGKKSLYFSLSENHTVSWFGYPKANGCVLNNVKWPLQNRALVTGGFQSVSNRSLGPIDVKQKSGRSILMLSLKPATKMESSR